MRQFGLLVLALLGVTQLGSADPIACVSGTLASYIALGSGGCTIGTNLLSDFTETSFLTGATNISPSDLTVTPIGGTTNPGITIDGSSIMANTGQTFDALINYVVSGNSYTSDTITLAGTNATGNGAVTDIQNFCQNGNFSAPTFVKGCPGGEGPGSPQVLLGDGSSMASVAASSLGITDNVTIDSGGAGTASGGTITDQFAAVATSAVPEPSTFVLSALGLALAVGRKLRTILKN